MSTTAAVIILAAGAGTRMKSSTPKVLHSVCGRTMMGHALAAARAVEPQRLAVVVRHEGERVAAHISELDPAALIAWQDEIPGTGRAVECALQALDAESPVDGTIIVIAGDTPLVDATLLQSLAAQHAASGATITVITAHLPDATGYGRILRADDGTVAGVVEHKDASDDQRTITEFNTSIYAFDAAALRSALAQVGSANAQGEKYITDVLGIVRADGGVVEAFVTDDAIATEGVNDRVQLATLRAELNRRILIEHMKAGVTIFDPATTWVDVDVTLAPDVTLLPGVQLHGLTTVESGATIGPDTTLTDCTVEADAQVVRSHAFASHIGAHATVGPFSYLRPGTKLGAGGKIGGFVETKNAVIGERSKVPHLSYVGDADIGTDTNIGAATVFVNYDGVHKARIRVGSHARVGSDNMLVAPVEIGDGAYTGAGSVIKEDVPPGALAVSQPKQRIIEGWVERKRPGTDSAAAARAANEGS